MRRIKTLLGVTLLVVSVVMPIVATAQEEPVAVSPDSPTTNEDAELEPVEPAAAATDSDDNHNESTTPDLPPQSVRLHMAAMSLQAQASVWGEGQNLWTLLPRKLTNRSLRTQLAAEPYRLGVNLPYVALAADASVGAEMARRRKDLTRYHGFFVVDTFAEVSPFSGCELNLNLTALNPSASDGYRYSSQVLPGAAVHLHYDLLWFGREPLHLEFVAPDLDVVTIGNGLLVEEVPLEGFAVGLSMAGITWHTQFGGRVFWPDDDLLSTTLSILDGALGVGWTRWLTEAERPLLSYSLTVAADGTSDAGYTAGLPTDYFTLFGELTPWPALHLAGEYGVSIRSQTRARQAALARADFLAFALGPFALHLGYQFRYYDQGFGPRDSRWVTPSTAPNTPYREDTYVTNSFEYLALAANFRQWSHTVMLETEVAVYGPVVFFGEGELWQRYISAVDDESPVAYVPRFGRTPGSSTLFYYRAGMRIIPWPDLPHRMSLYATNKLVASLMYAQEPSSQRFVDSTVLAFELEVSL